jgi:Xaa-Pro aminopeptidase
LPLLLPAFLFFLLAVSAMAQTLSVDPSEYAERRQRLADAAGPDALVLLFSASEAHRNGDVSWPFRQEDNLYYLTGVDEPETILALLPGEAEHREILFARDSDPREEIWNGRIPTHEELAAASGIAEVVSVERFGDFLEAALTGGWWGETTLYRYYRPAGLPRFSKAVAEGRAVVWMRLERRPGAGEPLTPELARVEELRRRFPELSFRDATPVLETLREVKSAAEIEILRRAVAITVEAHEAALRRTKSAEWEHQLQATVEFVFRDRGACCRGYPSIVASGERTTTLHYVDNDARIPQDGLLLLDIGAEVGHYTADLTRTWPASGTFSAPQREIYEAVLAAWREGLPLMRPGGSLKAVHLHTLEVLGRELLGLGLITENVQEQVELYFPHGVGHPMGLFVHDVFERTRPLEPGMVVTLEPGLYVRPDDVEASEVFQALEPEAQEKIRQALGRYAGIGVRIEDDVLVTEGEPEVLSANLARTVEEIEAFMAGE